MTMLTGLRPPHLTEADPDLLSEGSIDPLGMAALAERLAEEIAPWVTARMSRVRFVTAIAAASVATQDLNDLPPADGVTTPYLALEWHVIEAFARDRSISSRGIPGISKARSVDARRGHLDALSYLKGPKVFGFHGVYKRLARGMGIVDDDLLLGERGDQLVRVWEEEQSLPGFADRKPGTPGGKLAARLVNATTRALLEGRVMESSTSHLWSRLARAFHPDRAGPKERRLLWSWLTDASTPMRRELSTGIRGLGSIDDEAGGFRAIRPSASPELGLRLDAIEAYERLAELLITAFGLLRRASTSQGWVRPAEAARHPTMAECVASLGPAYREASDRLSDLGLEAFLDRSLGGLSDVTSPGDLVERLLMHHAQVQASKPPGKRAWFDESSAGIIVRPPYRLDEEPELRGRYVHPYRVWTIRQFIEDLA